MFTCTWNTMCIAHHQQRNTKRVHMESKLYHFRNVSHVHMCTCLYMHYICYVRSSDSDHPRISLCKTWISALRNNLRIAHTWKVPGILYLLFSMSMCVCMCFDIHVHCMCIYMYMCMCVKWCCEALCLWNMCVFLEYVVCLYEFTCGYSDSSTYIE